MIEGLCRGFQAHRTPARPNLRFQPQPGDGVIRIEDKTQPFEIAYRNTKISGRFDNDQGSVDLNFELGSRAGAQGQLLLGRRIAAREASAEKSASEFPDLALVSGFVPALERVQGRRTSRLYWGHSRKPRTTGILQVETRRLSCRQRGSPYPNPTDSAR